MNREQNANPDLTKRWSGFFLASDGTDRAEKGIGGMAGGEMNIKTRSKLAALAVLLVVCGVPVVAKAQVAGFNRGQQASMFLYQETIRQQSRARQQQQLLAIQQQFETQRRDINQTRQKQQSEMNQLLGLNPYGMDSAGQGTGGAPRLGGGTAVFGDPHFGSSLFNRKGPYYDYQFVARRNRPVPITIGGPGANRAPSSGYGGLFLGGGFGVFAVPY